MSNAIVNTDAFRQKLDSAHQRVDKALDQALLALPFIDMPLGRAMHYVALLGGKRLRPFLVYTVGEMFNIPVINLDVPAAAVECIHAYSLIHDDLPAMDNDDLRRGQPTCHIEFGEANAILAGDALQTLAFEILAKKPMPDVAMADRVAMIAELATASGLSGMCGGQALDLEAEDKSISLASLEKIHLHKTGALIRAAVRLGAYSAGQKGHDVLPALDKYAHSIGLAFQVQDDILDVIGTTEETGKRQGSDQQSGKSTYPALLGLAQAQKKAQELYNEALDALAFLEQYGYDTTTLKQLANFIVERKN